ncbi:molybdopterin-binding protein, partial [Weizmannia sp. CD-2023]|nr:molybdopterin-binding protein [Weizmannia sp. CD-2023]
MNAEIIAVGSELLLGQITNTNATFIAAQLAEIGVDVYYQTVVGDNAERLEAAIRTAEGRADLLIFTGGLGPTKDDLTKETI